MITRDADGRVVVDHAATTPQTCPNGSAIIGGILEVWTAEYAGRVLEQAAAAYVHLTEREAFDPAADPLRAQILAASGVDGIDLTGTPPRESWERYRRLVLAVQGAAPAEPTPSSRAPFRQGTWVSHTQHGRVGQVRQVEDTASRVNFLVDELGPEKEIICANADLTVLPDPDTQPAQRGDRVLIGDNNDPGVVVDVEPGDLYLIRRTNRRHGSPLPCSETLRRDQFERTRP